MWSDRDDDEVIAFQIDNIIWFGQAAIDEVRRTNRLDCYHTRAAFRFMALMDLGPKWGEYADNVPTLFLMSEIKNDSI